MPIFTARLARRDHLGFVPSALSFVEDYNVLGATFCIPSEAYATFARGVIESFVKYFLLVSIGIADNSFNRDLINGLVEISFVLAEVSLEGFCKYGNKRPIPGQHACTFVL